MRSPHDYCKLNDFFFLVRHTINDEDEPIVWKLNSILNLFFAAKEVFHHLQALISDSNIIDEAFNPANTEVK